MNDLQVILGAPIIGIGDFINWSPLGQKRLYQKVKNSNSTQFYAVKAEADEYYSLVYAMNQMGIPFRILLSHKLRCFKPFLELFPQVGLEWQPLTEWEETGTIASFPRDLAVLLPNKTILVNEEGFPGELPDQCGDWRLRKSLFGEGGRVQIRQDLAVIPEAVFVPGSPVFERTNHVEHLREGGIRRIVELPPAVHYREEHDEGINLGGFTPDDHIDRCCGLLEDEEGDLHLIVDPQIYSGYQGPRTLPLMQPRQVTRLIRERCEAAGVTMHAPRHPFLVPLATGFVQLSDRTVIMTGEDDYLSEIIYGLLPEEKVIKLPRAFQHIPAYMCAGIHCLITELPQVFLDLMKPADCRLMT